MFAVVLLAVVMACLASDLGGSNEYVVQRWTVNDGLQ